MECDANCEQKDDDGLCVLKTVEIDSGGGCKALWEPQQNYATPESDYQKALNEWKRKNSR